MNIRYVYKKDKEIKFLFDSLKSLQKDSPPAGFELVSIDLGTGIKDKTGVEIFAGDIFLPYRGEYSEYSHFDPSFISYEKHYASFRLLVTEDDVPKEMNKYVYEKFMVISGNIHENEEMLIVGDDDLIDKDMVVRARKYKKETLKII